MAMDLQTLLAELAAMYGQKGSASGTSTGTTPVQAQRGPGIGPGMAPGGVRPTLPQGAVRPDVYKFEPGTAFPGTLGATGSSAGTSAASATSGGGGLVQALRGPGVGPGMAPSGYSHPEGLGSGKIAQAGK